MRKKTLKRLAMALVPLAVLAGLTEGAARVAEVALWGAPYPDGRPKGLYEMRDGRPQLVPGAELPGLLVDVRINAWGFRDDPVVEPRPQDALRVWVVGGSTTFDIYARDNASTWPNLLEAQLQDALPERSVEVLNAGIPGETLMGSTDDLLAWGPTFQPQVVVLYHGPNDLRIQRMQGSLIDGPPPGRPGFLLQERVAVWRMLARGSRPAPWTQGGAFDPQRDLRMARDGLSRAIDATLQIGAQPLLATHPLQIVRDETGALGPEMHELAGVLQLPPDQAVAALDGYNQMVRDVARDRGFALVDVASVVPSDPENWGDLTHFRRPGSELCAAAVGQALLDQPALLEGDRGR